MSHHGLQVLYSLMNVRGDWACERAFTPWVDMEARTARRRSAAVQPGNVHAAVRFRRPRLHAAVRDLLDRTCSRCSTWAASRCTPTAYGDRPAGHRRRSLRQNPEPLAPFIDVFVTGDGEPSLPRICDRWLELRDEYPAAARRLAEGDRGCRQREEMLARMAADYPFCYVPRFYEPEYVDGRFAALNRTRSDVPETIEPSVIADLDAIPLPTKPDRAVRRMRSRPHRHRDHARLSVAVPLLPEHGHQAAVANSQGRDDRQRGAGKLSQHGLQRDLDPVALQPATIRTSRSWCTRLQEVFNPLGVNICVPSLRVNEQLRSIAGIDRNEPPIGLTLAPEVARDDMREQIRKKIKNEDLYEGCRQAFRKTVRKRQAVFPVRPARRATRRSRRHHRDGRDDRARSARRNAAATPR